MQYTRLFVVPQLRKWIRNLEAEARPHSSEPPTYPKILPPTASAKLQAKPKPKRELVRVDSALVTQRLPRLAAVGAVARLRVVLHEHDNLDDDDESAEESMTVEEGDSVRDDASDDGLSLGVTPPCTPRGAELAGGADWSRR